MKLLFINNYFHPDLSATSRLLSDLAFNLADKGHDVTVICSRTSYTDPSVRHMPREVIRKAKVERIGTPALSRSNMLGRALGAVLFHVFLAVRLWRLVDRQTQVVALTDPPLIGLTAGFVCRRKGARLINWLQDLFPETAIALRIRPMVGPLGKLVARWRNSSLQHAAANVVIAKSMQQTLVDQGIEEERIRVIPNWADGTAIQPIASQDNPLRESWGLADKFVVMYSGTLGRAHEFDTLLSAAIALKDVPEIRFLFVGGGILMAQLRQQARRHGLNNCLFKPYQPIELLSQSLGIGDVHIVSLRSVMANSVLPSKYYGIAAAGRACIYIGCSNDEIPRLLERTSSGLTVGIGESQKLASEITSLRESREHVAMGERARRLFEDEFDFPLATQRWQAALYEQLRSKG